MAIDLGLTPSEDDGLRRLLAKPLTHHDIAILGTIWYSVANPGETAKLTGLGVAETLFNNHRRRFWRAVRGNPNAKSLFLACGCTFPIDPQTSPLIKLRPGYKTLQGKEEIRLDIDHA